MVINAEEINASLAKDPQSFIASHEKSFKIQIEKVADYILKQHHDINIVMMSGPSSSGKTTTSIMLHDELKLRGHKCHAISLDNFYNPNLERTNGKADLESVTALNMELLGQCFTSLHNGESVILPVFDFALRKTIFSGKEIRLEKGDCIIVEGIHALNPVITDIIAPYGFSGIYISFETSFAENGEIILEGRDARLIRRIVRDYNFRGSSVENSLSMWSDVVKGEINYIKPFRERAHIRINSGLAHDISVLRPFAEKLFDSVSPDSEYYSKCQKICGILKKFTPVETDLVPQTSLLREFIGGFSAVNV